MNRSNGFGVVVLLVIAAFSALNVHAHPGHDLVSHGWLHAITSPFHLAIMACSGLVALALAQVVRKPMAAKGLRFVGISVLLLAAVLFGTA